MAFDHTKLPPWKCPRDCRSNPVLKQVRQSTYKLHQGSMDSLTFHFDAEEESCEHRVECPDCGTSWPVPEDCCVTFEMVES
jgi:hypothetical protein